jgi:hypothetical protein
MTADGNAYLGANLLPTFQKPNTTYRAPVFSSLILNVARADLQYNVTNV